MDCHAAEVNINPTIVINFDRIAQDTGRRETHISLTNRHKLHNGCPAWWTRLQFNINT